MPVDSDAVSSYFYLVVDCSPKYGFILSSEKVLNPAAEISSQYKGSILKWTMSPTCGTDPCSLQVTVSLLQVYFCSHRESKRLKNSRFDVEMVS